MTTLTDLIKSAEEKLANPDLTLGTRRREEAILHHLTNLERTVTELESQNTEMYVDLCEMGDMARERSRMRFRANGKNHDQYEMKAVDVMTGEVLHRALTDTLIRHKWPEEKPGRGGDYLVRIYGDEWAIGNYFMDGWLRYAPINDEWENVRVTHWWNLPEVTE